VLIWLALCSAIVVLVDQPGETSLILGNIGKCNNVTDEINDIVDKAMKNVIKTMITKSINNKK